MSHGRRAGSPAAQHRRDRSPAPELPRLASSKSDLAAAAVAGCSPSDFFFMVALDAAGSSALGVKNRPGGEAACVTVNGVELRATGIVDGCDLRRHLRALTDGCLAAAYTRDSDGNEGHGWHEPDGGEINGPPSSAAVASSSSTCYAGGVVLTPVAAADGPQRAAALRAVVAALSCVRLREPQQQQPQQPAAHFHGKWVLYSVLRRDTRGASSAEKRSSSPGRRSIPTPWPAAAAKAVATKLRTLPPRFAWLVPLVLSIIVIVAMFMWGPGMRNDEAEKVRLLRVDVIRHGLGPERSQCPCFRDMDNWPVERVAEVEQRLPQLGLIGTLVESEHVPDPERAKYLCCSDAAKLTELLAELEAKRSSRHSLIQLLKDLWADAGGIGQMSTGTATDEMTVAQLNEELTRAEQILEVQALYAARAEAEPASLASLGPVDLAAELSAARAVAEAAAESAAW